MLAFTDGEGVEQRSGKIININTASKYIENPISLNAPSMTGGKGMRISTPSITSGSALQITTMGGNNMKGSLDPVPVKIWKDGTVTVYNKGAKHNLTNGEFINLSNCTMEDNNGEFIITLLEDTTRRLMCTNMEYYDYLIEGYVNNNTVVVKVDEMSTVIYQDRLNHISTNVFSIGENVTISSCDDDLNNGRYQIKNTSNVSRVSSCFTTIISAKPIVETFGENNIVLETKYKNIFSIGDNLSISNCMNTSNNRDYANLTSMESIYRKYQCTNDVVVSLNPLYDVASTTSSGTLYLTKYVAENFAINNQVQLVGCSDAIYNRNYTISEVVASNIIQVRRCN
jgi:hypothetical protein